MTSPWMSIQILWKSHWKAYNYGLLLHLLQLLLVYQGRNHLPEQLVRINDLGKSWLNKWIYGKMMTQLAKSRTPVAIFYYGGVHWIHWSKKSSFNSWNQMGTWSLNLIAMYVTYNNSKFIGVDLWSDCLSDFSERERNRRSIPMLLPITWVFYGALLEVPGWITGGDSMGRFGKSSLDSWRLSLQLIRGERESSPKSLRFDRPHPATNRKVTCAHHQLKCKGWKNKFAYSPLSSGRRRAIIWPMILW